MFQCFRAKSPSVRDFFCFLFSFVYMFSLPSRSLSLSLLIRRETKIMAIIHNLFFQLGHFVRRNYVITNKFEMKRKKNIAIKNKNWREKESASRAFWEEVLTNAFVEKVFVRSKPFLVRVREREKCCLWLFRHRETCVCRSFVFVSNYEHEYHRSLTFLFSSTCWIAIRAKKMST